ncbi:hypothetical protein LBMAG33_7160 [Candidatus Levyibacteriota bacterium]|nr:thioredoxin domain-containing protein [Candidatus Levybacteria bacterium]GDX62406.1 hypothetical protein LBMAG33_7160 [Candidatus Levybacteria bacterium]
MAFLIGGLYLLIIYSDLPENTSSGENIAPKISDTDNIRQDESVKSGSISASVTLIEYGDFQCPACSKYHFILKQLEENFKKELKVVFRHFPLTNIHKNAMLAAQSAHAAGLQNKFWEMHDLIFENQDKWSDTDPIVTFIEYANALNLDTKKFVEDMQAESTKKFILDQQLKGSTAGVMSTPSFFLNEKLIESPSDYEEFKKIIQDEINKK